MSDDLTDSQISLLCDIEEHDPARSSSDAKRDLERLIAEGYRAADCGPSGLGFRAHGQGYRVSRRARRRAE